MKIAVIASLLLSILATTLFFGQNLGISVLLFVLPLILFTMFFLEKHRKVKNKKGCILVIPILLLSSTYAIYQNMFFRVTNIIIMVTLYNIMLLWIMTEKYQLEFAIKRIFNIMIKPFHYINETCKEIGKVFRINKLKTEESSSSWKIIKQIGTGIVVSIPILIIVIALLASADSLFAEGTQNVLLAIFENGRVILDLPFWFTLVAKLLTICALTIYFISYMINILSQKPWSTKEEKTIKIQIETTILNTVVTILNIIYIIFCKIQITNLFAKIATNDMIDYANYAREGFFQLMAVSLINFIIIIISTKNNSQSSKMQIYYRKIMNLVLLVATAIILSSAFIRMNLYGEEFGYTFLRILVYFALITESILLLPTIVYIFKDTFPVWKSYFIIITIMYVIMNFSNINQMIAKKNIDRYLNEGKKIDIYYLMKTKTDGLEEVIKLYETIEDQNLKYQLENYLDKMKNQLEEKENIVEWNYSTWKARELLKREGV